MLRDKLLARLRGMGDRPDHQRLAAEVLGIRGASEELARRLVTQALVVEDRREAWRRAGERICRAAPSAPGVYVIRDEDGRALYVGKAVNLRRRLRAHFVERQWRATKRTLRSVSPASRRFRLRLPQWLRAVALMTRLSITGWPRSYESFGPRKRRGRRILKLSRPRIPVRTN